MSRAMIVVAAGSSSRFGADKMMIDIRGKPLVAHTVQRVSGVVDDCVLVCRADQRKSLASLLPGVMVVVGGTTRTESEMAGLAALGDRDLIGIHDGARPLVSTKLVETLFERAEEDGGAVPVLEPSSLIIDRRTHQPVDEVVTVQTPQVFRGPALLAAFARAARTGFSGDDTMAVVHRFGDLVVVAVPGEPGNLKVTYPEDLARVNQVLGTNAHSEPR